MSEIIPFIKDLRFEYGVLETVSRDIRRIVARNPSPFTYTGTGTYVLGHGEVAVIDPGPLLTEHVDALLAGLHDERVTHILVTHTHLDHSPAAATLAQRTGATIYGFGPHRAGRHGATADDGADVEEGADLDFSPHVEVRDGDVLEGGSFQLTCVHTPGHASNHICYALRSERALFTGDHVMGWSTSVIAPPDGDMGDYLRSLERLLARDDLRYFPTHGAPIDDPKPFVRAFIAHRRAREQQILSHLAAGPARIADMVPAMYANVPVFLHAAAARSVFAHLLHLHERGLVACEGTAGLQGVYRAQ